MKQDFYDAMIPDEFMLTDAEWKTYYYLLGKEGKKSAEDFWNKTENNRDSREGNIYGKVFEKMPVFEMFYGIPAGQDQFLSGIKQLFSEDRIPTTVTGYTAQHAREDLADFGPKLPDWLGGGSLGQAGFDVLQTSTNMAPSIAVSVGTGGLGAPVWLAQGAGAATMALSAGGNYYSQALDMGMTKDQAHTYAILSGASEGGLQYLLGGIGKLGGKITGKGINALVGNINNTFLKGAANLGLHMLSEGTEEYLQDIINVALQNTVTGSNKQINLLDPQYLYDFMMGAITAGVMEAPGQIRGNISSSKSGSAVINAGKAMELIQNALKLDPRSEAYKLAQKLQSGTLIQSNTNIGELMITYKKAGVDVSFMSRPADNMRFIPVEEYEAASQKMQAQNIQSSENPIGNTLPQTDTNTDKGSGAKAAASQARQINSKTEKLVSVLKSLPPDVKAKIGYEAIFDAMFAAHLNGGNVKLAHEALEKAKAGIEAALAADGLDEGTRETLEGLLDNIDSEGEMGDNKSEKIEGGNVNKDRSEVVLKQKLADKIAQEYNAKYNPVERAKSKGFEGIGTTANGGVTFEGTKYMFPVEEGQLNRVTIQAQGNRSDDFDKANSRAGLDATPNDVVWHHLDDYNVSTGELTLELVYEDAHRATVPHVGSCAQYDAVHGPSYNK